MHLDNAVVSNAPSIRPSHFLERLAALFESRKDKGSVFITQKRFTYNDGTSATAAPATSASTDVEAGDDDVAMTDSAASPSSSSASPQTEYPLLVRATDGRSKKDIKVKLSTIVHPSAYATFTNDYTSLLRSQLSSALRPKRKRSAASKPKPKKLKAKATATAGGRAREDDVEVETPRGGGGAGAGAGAGAGFVVRLPKVVGPRRGNGVKKRRRAEKRREKAVARIQKVREERKRRAGGAGAGGAA
ncbi:hypothetical protein JCM1840_005288 [Sporobolomyces johnsonii]